MQSININKSKDESQNIYLLCLPHLQYLWQFNGRYRDVITCSKWNVKWTDLSAWNRLNNAIKAIHIVKKEEGEEEQQQHHFTCQHKGHVQFMCSSITLCLCVPCHPVSMCHCLPLPPPLSLLLLLHVSICLFSHFTCFHFPFSRCAKVQVHTYIMPIYAYYIVHTVLICIYCTLC